jgi:hypothetical protein
LAIIRAVFFRYPPLVSITIGTCSSLAVLKTISSLAIMPYIAEKLNTLTALFLLTLNTIGEIARIPKGSPSKMSVPAL